MNSPTQMNDKPSRIVSMEFPNKTARAVPMVAGSILLLMSVCLLGQQSSQNSAAGTSATNGQSKTSQPPPGKAQGSGSSGSSSAPARQNPSTSNPFPMAQSEAAAKADAQKNGQQTTPSTQGDSSAASGSSSGASKSGSDNGKSGQNSGKSAAAQANPFPEAQSAAAAKGAQEARQTQENHRPAPLLPLADTVPAMLTCRRPKWAREI